MLVVEAVLNRNACCLFLFKNTQKTGCLILHYREGSFSCGDSTCYIVRPFNFLAKLLTRSKRRDDKTVRLHEVRGYSIFPHTSKILFLPKSSPCTRILIFLKTEIFSLFTYLKNMSPEVV